MHKLTISFLIAPAFFLVACEEEAMDNAGNADQAAGDEGTDTATIEISDARKAELIQRIEELVIESGRLEIDLSRYDRRYSFLQEWPQEPGDPNTVHAVYAGTMEGPGTAEWVDDRLFNPISDGGCEAIELSYNITEDRLLSFNCNGEA